MRHSSEISKHPDGGFTLVELLATIVISVILVAGFGGFYLSEQRAARHHHVEIETSQALRTALEQMSRDLRSARKDLTRDFKASPPSGGASPVFLTADVSSVEFQLDANDDGTITSSDPYEHRGFRRNAGASTIEQLDASSSSWDTLADYVSALTFRYFDCSQTELAAPVASPDNIASVAISISVHRDVIAGLPVDRTETENVQLRNRRCP